MPLQLCGDPICLRVQQAASDVVDSGQASAERRTEDAALFSPL